MLAIFGAAFLVLFAIVAIAEGVGEPSIPSGNVMLVEGLPGDKGEISEEDFERGLEQAAAQAGMKKAPEPGDPKYEELKETTLKELLEPVWLEGLGNELGITVSEKEVDEELEKAKDENFQSEAEYKAFLKQARYTTEDVKRRLKLRKLGTDIQERLKEEVPQPSEDEIEDYYEAAKATQFTQQPTREVRIVVSRDRKKIEEALAALNEDNSDESWEKVAKKYSEDPTTKDKGGLRKQVTEGATEEPLDAAIFNALEGQVEGPIKTQQGYNVFEVENSTPESVQELKAVEGQIQSQLAQRAEQEFFTAYVSSFNTKWTSRTFCAPGYETQSCSNYEFDGHPQTAPPGCYEADPKGGRPEACPAPVFQLIPALPGSVTPLEPQGKPLAQRSRPGPEAGGGAEVPTGLPPGATPPPAEAPPSE